MLELVPLADSVVKLTAVCHNCASEAAFTKRTVASEELQLIGGAEAYIPVCRVCFLAGSSSSAAAAAAAVGEVAEPAQKAGAAGDAAPGTPLSAIGSPRTPQSPAASSGRMAGTPDPLPLPAGALGEAY